MRIAIFSDTFSPEVNGVAHTVHFFAEMLAHRGHDVCVITVSGKSRKELEHITKNRFKIITLPSLPVPVYNRQRASLSIAFSVPHLLKYRPDVIHTHTPFGVGWEAITASKMLRIPLVGTHHTFFDHYLKHVYLDYHWTKKFSWRYTTAYYNRCTVVTSPSQALADELTARGLTRPIDILPNAIDTDLFQPGRDTFTEGEYKRSFGIPGKSIVYMGRLSYEKSIDQVIHATALAARQLPDARLIIIGDGPERAKLEKLSQDLGIKDCVLFTGFLYGDVLAKTLSMNDVFVTASKSENMPLSVLEAMSSGLPIIAPSALGLREMVRDGVNGYLFRPDDIHDMAAKIIEVLQNDKIGQQFGNASREHSLAHTSERIAERCESIYQKVLAFI